MGMIEDLLRQHVATLIEQLTSGGAAPAGLDTQQLKALIPATGQQLDSAIDSGQLDLASLLGGANLEDLLAKLDIASIARAVGVDADSAKGGLSALLPAVLSLVKSQSRGAGALLDSVGGDAAGGLLGAAGKLAGGFFGKK